MILTWNHDIAAGEHDGPHAVSIGLMLVLFFVFMVLGMPIAYCMGLAAIVTVLADGQLPVLLLAQQFYDSLDNFSLLAVPLFILAGELMSVAGITERLVNMSRALIGHLRGGLAQANILTNMFMGAISGSALADLAAIGSMMIPAMKREGYKPAFAVAVTACAAMMAPIIPPSIIAVIYGSVTGVSIGALFLGGVIPGVLAGIGDDAPHLVPGAARRCPPVAAGLRRRGGIGDGPRDACAGHAGHHHRRHPVRRLHARPKPVRSRRSMRCCSVSSAAATRSHRSIATSPRLRRLRRAR